MANSPLLDYAKNCKRKSLADEDIINSLKKSGWQIEDVQEAFYSIILTIQID